MNNNNISVVIPLYNKEKHIYSTLESVLKQKYTYFEILVVNDGSTDNSIDIVKSIKDDRITIIEKQNGGVSSSRNVGIQNAKYNWIAFLDADDLWDEHYLAEVNEMINLFRDADIIGVNYDCLVPFSNKKYSKKGYVEEYFKISINEYLFYSSSVVIKKEILISEHFREDLSNGEDLEMWHRLAKKYKIAYCPRILVFYLKDPEVESRRVKKNNINTDWAYHINLNDCSDFYEKKYLQKVIASSFILLVRNKLYTNLFKLLKKQGFKNIVSSVWMVVKHKYNK